MADLNDNAITFRSIWIMCDKCNKRLRIVMLRSCADKKGNSVLVADIEPHVCVKRRR